MKQFALRNLQLAIFPLVLCCVALISVGSRIGVHPDETLHVASARYFEDHWLPPIADEGFARYLDPAYGVSYALSVPPEFVYFYYGKVGAFVRRLGGAFAYGCRYAALILFGLLCVWLMVKRPEHPAFAFMLLATPQVWYVFAYVNGDAWGMFASFAVVWQLGYRESSGRKFLDGTSGRMGAIAIGLAFAALALCKRNYTPFFLYALVYGTLLVYRDRAKLARWCAALAIGACLAGGITLFDEARNGFAKEKHGLELREEHAELPWRQSSIDNGTAMNGLGLKQKGVPLRALLVKPWNWIEGIYDTFLGVYGPMSIWFPPYEYYLRGAAFALLAGLALYGARKNRLSLIAGITLAIGIIIAALDFAWTYDFQPQGRYIFAIIPILALLWTHDERPKRVAWAAVSLAFLLGYYSMVRLGIPELLAAHRI